LSDSHIQKSRGRDENGIRPLTTNTFKGCIDFKVRVSAENLKLQTHGASGRFYIVQRSLGTNCFGRIDNHGNADSDGRPDYKRHKA
jgi:hypothetical protein